MITVNPKKLKPYGDRLDDGMIQMSFTLPVQACPEAREAARLYVEKLGLDRVQVAQMDSMGEGFTYFVVYGAGKNTLDFTKIRVPKIETPVMHYEELKSYMERNLKEPIVVVGAATGADAHTVGIDAIMNMKGYDHDYGLERYPLFTAHNLRSQLTNEQLLDRAVELKADVILISQVVTQRDCHIKNLKAFRALAKKDSRLPKELLLIVGGPRLDHAVAVKLGFDAGYGTGTKPSEVASFIVREYMKRHKIAEQKEEEAQEVPTQQRASRATPKAKPHPKAASTSTTGRSGRSRGRRAPTAKEAAAESSASKTIVAAKANPVAEVKTEEQQANKPKRRRGKRGGRRHRKKVVAAPSSGSETK